MPEVGPVIKYYQKIPTLVDYMKNFGPKKPSWQVIANDFVLKSENNPRVAEFVMTVQQAKLEIERKMRRDLDD